MTPADLAAYPAALAAVPAAQVKRVLLFSPNLEQLALVRQQFPGARVYCSDKSLWNLSDCKDWAFDLAFLCNVMHYSPDPALWLKNLFQACRYVVVQDLIDRRRGTQAPYLGTDGDATRYSFRARGERSAYPHAYDLSHLDAQCTYFQAYAASNAARHFVAVYTSPYPRRTAGTAKAPPVALGVFTALYLARKQLGRLLSPQAG